MRPSFQESGIVLRINPVRDYDLMVTLLLENSGKVSAIARSARRSKKRFLGGLDIFDCGNFSLKNTKDPHLLELDSTNNKTPWPNLRNNMSKLSLASLCLECTNIFAQEGDQDSCFYLNPLKQALTYINSCGEKNLCRGATVWFLLHLLSHAGYDPLHATVEVEPQTMLFWQQLSSHNRPSDEIEEATTNQSLATLLTMTQEIIGKPLNSAALVA